MTTVYDYLTMAIFAGLIVLFLQRSVAEVPHDDHLWQYLVAASGCAIANYVGNQGYSAVAAIVIVAVVAFIVYVLRPLPNFPKR